jgi:type IV fimbrial biogenesis protein FimT
MGKRTAQYGFTLGETLATLSVVGIALALAVPELHSVTANNRRAAAVNDLVSTMHLARSEAVMRNQRVTVCASLDGKSCAGHSWEQGWIAFIDSDGDGQRAGAETIIDHVPSLAGMRLDSAQFGNALTYRPDGRAMGPTPDISTGEFTFCEAGAETATRVVAVRANGLPSLSGHGRDGKPAACPTS